MTRFVVQFWPDLAVVALFTACVLPQVVGVLAQRASARGGPHEIAGRVRVGPLPAAGAEIQCFQQAEGHWLESGRAAADAAGHFRLRNLAAGSHVATLSWRPRIIDGELFSRGPNVLDSQYQSPDRSPLRVEVSEHAAPSPDWRLSVCECEPCRSRFIPCLSGVVP